VDIDNVHEIISLDDAPLPPPFGLGR